VRDCTLFAWDMMSKGNYQYARMKATESDEPNEEDMHAWKEIQDSYIDEFGLSESYQRILGLRIQLARIQNDYILSSSRKHIEIEGEWVEVISRDESLTPIINELQKQIEDELNSNKGVALIDLKRHIDKAQGFHVNPKEITVYDYKSILNDIEQQHKASA